MKLAKLSLALGIALTVATGTLAQTEYPSKPVKLVVPFPPGGAVDIVGRYVAEKLTARWGQTVVVENLPGAGTAIGSANVSKAAPDGYTLLINSATFTMIAAVQDVPYDPAEDFTAIGMVGSVPLLLVTGPAMGVDDYESFVEMAKSRPLKYATVGVGTMNHFATEMLEVASGLQFDPVHYSGGSPAMTDVIGGHVDFFYGSMTQVVPQVEAGLMTGILLSSAERSEAAPEFPALRELGLEDAAISQWWGIFGPKGMDQAIVDRISADLLDIIKTDDTREFLARNGAVPETANAAEFAEIVVTESERWRELAESNNIRAD